VDNALKLTLPLFVELIPMLIVVPSTALEIGDTLFDLLWILNWDEAQVEIAINESALDPPSAGNDERTVGIL